MATHSVPHVVLRVSDLSVLYETERGVLPAVRSASMDVARRESLGIVGESGSGKSTLIRGLLNYLPPNGRVTSGSATLNDRDLRGMSPAELRGVWGSQVGVVYQDPLNALNPSLTIGRQLREVATRHLGMNKRQATDLALEQLTKVSMPGPQSVIKRYPHQLSGGMLQRCVIAMALMTRPALLILDEPTTALDVTTQAVVLDLVRELKEDFDAAILYVTHDLGVVARICDRIAVMYAGEIVEIAETHELFSQPRHPYTLSLLGCIPHFELTHEKATLLTIPGSIPRLDDLPPGCAFAPRCSAAQEACRVSPPTLANLGGRRFSACLRWAEVAPADEMADRVRKVVGSRAEELTDDQMLVAEDVHVTYAASGRGLQFRRERREVKAVDGASVTLRPGQTLGVVGESGSGKTTLARAIIGLSPRTDGSVQLNGAELAPSADDRPTEAVRAMSMVFQSPDASLNPRHTVGEALRRPLLLLGGMRGKELDGAVEDLLAAVKLPVEYKRRYPGELSGGEKQRVAIARACAANPAVVMCDEPLSSLDVSVQGALMNLLMQRQADCGVAFLFISHDLSAVQHMSDWIAVMYLGKILEFGSTAEVMRPPFHPYTEALISAIPVADPDVIQEEIRLGGSVPSATNVPPGCRFHPRCPRFLGEQCRAEEPPWLATAGSHRIRCHIAPAELAADQVGVVEARARRGGQESAPC